MKKKVDLGNQIILFGSMNCGACLAQIKLLHDYYSSKNKKLNFMYYNLDKKKAPDFLMDSKGNYSMPTWYCPSSKSLFVGIILPNEFEKKMKQGNSFGNSVVPEIDTLAKYGKTFGPTGTNFNIAPSWSNELTQKWGDPKKAGTLGREFGPRGTDGIYSKNYFYKPRMAYPGGDLSEVLSSNQNCNMINNPKAATQNVGLFYDSKYQSSFGSRKNKKNYFGKDKLYPQMGPAYERGNQYLVQKNTFRDLYAGAGQNDLKKPNKVQNNRLYISKNVDQYNPINKPKVGEGSVLSIGKKGKVLIN